MKKAGQHWMKTAVIGCCVMMTACATQRVEPIALPELVLPAEVFQPCQIATLPDQPTAADLEEAYMLRGLQILRCDAARELAVTALHTERRMGRQTGRQ